MEELIEKVSLKKKILKILKGIGDTAYILIFVLAAYIFITVYMGQIPSIGGYRFLKAVGGSMEPIITKGDCIIIKNIDANKVKVGDIITFFSDDPQILGYPNTHRVMKIEVNEGHREFVTKGDYNSEEDRVTAKEEKLIGKYIGDVWLARLITKLFEILSNRTVYFVVMILPILLGLIVNIVDLVKIITDTDEEDNKESINC
mgnify:CR=1 FL=1